MTSPLITRALEHCSNARTAIDDPAAVGIDAGDEEGQKLRALDEIDSAIRCLDIYAGNIGLGAALTRPTR